MMNAPYQWRADEGYISSAQPPPGMLVFPGQPLYMQVAQPPVHYIPAPIGITALYTAPIQDVKTASPSSKGKIGIPPPPPKPHGMKKDAGSVDKKPKSDRVSEGADKPPKAARPTNTNSHAPPPLMPGTNYMFPPETLRVHIFKNAAKVWEPKYQGRRMEFKIFEVDPEKTVTAMIEYTMGIKTPEDRDRCKGWAATEVYEQGDSTFLKGSTIEYVSDKAKGTLTSMGWSTQRGKALPPVWITIHKI